MKSLPVFDILDIRDKFKLGSCEYVVWDRAFHLRVYQQIKACQRQKISSLRKYTVYPGTYIQDWRI